jgi:hypothetical protein
MIALDEKHLLNQFGNLRTDFKAVTAGSRFGKFGDF